MAQSAEPRGVNGQKAAYCLCGAVYFSQGHVRHQHFAKGEGHERITWRRFRELWPNLTQLLLAP